MSVFAAFKFILTYLDLGFSVNLLHCKNKKRHTYKQERISKEKMKGIHKFQVDDTNFIQVSSSIYNITQRRSDWLDVGWCIR